MSYRTYINHIQVFGNNEFYQEWLDFIKSEGIEVSEECTYDGEISDVMGAIKTIEKIILRLAKEQNGPVVSLPIANTIAKDDISPEKKNLNYKHIHFPITACLI